MSDPASELSELTSVEASIALRIATASEPDELSALANEVNGRGSVFVAARRQIGSLPPDERRQVGRAVHDAMKRLESLLIQRREELEASGEELRRRVERLDLTEVVSVRRRGHLHLVSQAQMELEDVFLGMGFVVAEGPEIETDWYNFEALNMPRDHPARGMFDTFYLRAGEPGSLMLRTHTSPVQVRLMESESPPISAVMPGVVHRRDTADARHTPTFHQIEGLVVDQGVTFADLAGTIEAFTGAYFGPSSRSRLRPSYFPFTEPSAEFEITCTICGGSGCRTCSGTGWIELGGCGLVDPAVFEAVGIDPEVWTGFAFGFGIDRCVQMRHGIADIRVLMENDLRFLEQF